MICRVGLRGTARRAPFSLRDVESKAPFGRVSTLIYRSRVCAAQHCARKRRKIQALVIVD
jgi:hypothetical protein